jgi:quinone-modifying oxidoreductase subunit QmoA
MTEENVQTVDEKAIVVIGGGISGLTTAVEAAEAGKQVVIVEKSSYLGGRVAQLYQYFPKMCPPTCGLEINFQRIKKKPDLRYYTLAEVEKIEGEAGNQDVTINIKPRFINEKCTGCGKCAEACPVERSNDFNYGLDKTKAAYLPHEMAFPMRYVIDMSVCKGKECNKCAEACEYGAVDLDMKEKKIQVKAGSVVSTTGWKPYDPAKIDTLGFGTSPDIITNVMMERLAAPNGPTGGKITRLSDGKEAKRVVFVQCAGSRDRLHLPFCSSVCCLASLKQTGYVRTQYEDAEITMFYIDVRAPGKLEDFFTKAQEENKINLIKGKVAKVTADKSTGEITVEAEDIIGGGKMRVTADLVVLATGMQPAEGSLPGVAYDENSFAVSGAGSAQALSAGCSRRPVDVATAVQDATGVALKAIQAMVRS